MLRFHRFNMNKKNVLQLAALSAIGSFLAGISYERNRYFNRLNKSENPYLLYARSDIKKVHQLSQNHLISKKVWININKILTAFGQTWPTHFWYSFCCYSSCVKTHWRNVTSQYWNESCI